MHGTNILTDKSIVFHVRRAMSDQSTKSIPTSCSCFSVSRWYFAGCRSFEGLSLKILSRSNPVTRHSMSCTSGWMNSEPGSWASAGLRPVSQNKGYMIKQQIYVSRDLIQLWFGFAYMSVTGSASVLGNMFMILILWFIDIYTK